MIHSFKDIFSNIAHENGKFTHDVIENQLAHTIRSKVSQAHNSFVSKRVYGDYELVQQIT